MLAPHANSYLCNLFAHIPGLILTIQNSATYMGQLTLNDNAFHA